MPAILPAHRFAPVAGTGAAPVLECPDETLVGRNFADIAAGRGIHVVDLFLDLVVQYGRQLRWVTTIGNHRPALLQRLLKMVYDSHQQGSPIMSLEKAVWRVTGEQADWLGVAAGRIREGDRADIAVINPDGFGRDLEQAHCAEMENFGLQRLVNRNAGLVEHVIINGRLAVENEILSPALGHQTGFGAFLPAS